MPGSRGVVGRPAPCAGPQPGGLRLSRRLKEHRVLAQRQPRCAARPAIDPSRADTVKELAVRAGFAPRERRPAFLEIQHLHLLRISMSLKMEERSVLLYPPLAFYFGWAA